MRLAKLDEPKANKGERRNKKGERKNLRVSESRSKVHFDYAEREQIQDRKAGLKEKGK